jgi:hypothetical protein
MNIVSQNVSSTLQQEKEREKETKIKERIALNQVWSVVLIPIFSHLTRKFELYLIYLNRK